MTSPAASPSASSLESALQSAIADYEARNPRSAAGLAEAPTLARHLPALADKAFIVRWSSGREQPLEAGFAAWCEVIVEGLEALRNLS